MDSNIVNASLLYIKLIPRLVIVQLVQQYSSLTSRRIKLLEKKLPYK